MKSFRIFCVVLKCSSALYAASYEVGPSTQFNNISEVPLESLKAGDTVLIHWRAESYKEKIAISGQGSADAPITIRGVAGPKGELPVIDGDGATTRKQLNFWGDVRALIRIGVAKDTPNKIPQHIVIENLDIRNGRPPFKFTAADGSEKVYARRAAGIHIERAEHVTIRNCVLHDCGNGLFISSGDDSVTRDVLIEGNHIFDNGNILSGYEHNAYTEAIDIMYQFNHFGPLRKGCPGINLKDRSAGLIVRCNWIDGGDKQLDLVDAEDSRIIRETAAYRQTFVCGNVLIQPKSAAHPFTIQYGGDSSKASFYRKGTLYFYNNTVISERLDHTILFRISTDEETVECFNNILYVPTARNAAIGIVSARGVVHLRNNWIKEGWKPAFNRTAKVHVDDSNISGVEPGFVDLTKQDFHLNAKSPCRDQSLRKDKFVLSDGKILPVVDQQYIKHQSREKRLHDGKLDIGAFEFAPR
jgi:hypothetical protein